MIFVFGSNLAGRHGRGAALFARNNHGAKYGVGEGRTGDCYAIPTKDGDLQTRSLADIKESVNRFVDYAKSNPELGFEVTKIGCGLAGYQESDISPLFAQAPHNCILPAGWWPK